MRLVLLPGMDGTGVLFAGFVHALRGALEASIVPIPREVENWEAWLPLARAALPTREDYLLLGESFSGGVAMHLAAEAPPGLRGLVLVGAFARNPRPWLGRVIARLPLAPRPAFLLGRRAPALVRRAFADAVASVPARTLRARMRSLERLDARAALGRITVPLLVLQAAQDRVVPARATQEILRLQPQARRVLLDGPHLLLQAEPARAAAVVLGWVGTRPGSRIAVGIP